jgi:hypothetical protein
LGQGLYKYAKPGLYKKKKGESMPEDADAQEKGTEDIVQRLEALRKKAPEGETEKSEEVTEESVEGGPTESRQRVARIVGVFVIFLVVAGVFFGAYKVIYEPIMKKKVASSMIEQEQAQAVINARDEKFNEINNGFSGLPSKYITQKTALLEELQRADTLEKANAIYVTGPADTAWRDYRTDQMDEKLVLTDKLKMTLGNDTYRGYDEIKQKIDQFPYQTLKSISIETYSSEYFPIRLTREQAAGGWAEQGSLVNIWLGGDETSSLLARNARVIAVLRGSSSGVISLSETESKTASGGGSEGKGTVSSVSSGGVGSISGTFPASAGYQTTQTQTNFNVDILEVQKAAAASKLGEGYIESVLGNYGVKLNKIEADTGIADFSAEYIILFEVGETEVSDLVLRASPNSGDRANIFITISSYACTSSESILCPENP